MHRTDDLRATARRLYDAAVTAAEPGKAVARQLSAKPLPKVRGRTVLIAIGKAAPAMLAEALRHVEGPHEALAVTHHENTQAVSGARVLKAGHPVPDAAGAVAGRAVMDLLDTAGADDQVIALISGGGSALVPTPVDGLSLADKAVVNQLLLSAGLDIVTMNLVRQQLSQLKGGGFLRRAAPAPVTALILSDVIGDDLRAIASGPTVGPIGTAAEASAVLKDHGLWDKLPEAARRVLATDRPAGPVPQATNIMVGSNGQSVAAMADLARAEGWDVRLSDSPLVGDVEAAAGRIVTALIPEKVPTALLLGGETTVILRGDGRGGRNQELALRVALTAPALAQDWLFLSGGTDGRDGPTDAAGGLVDAGTAARIADAGHDAAALLANNDSYAALAASGDLLMTAATGTNVADVQVLLIRP